MSSQEETCRSRAAPNSLRHVEVGGGSVDDRLWRAKFLDVSSATEATLLYLLHPSYLGCPPGDAHVQGIVTAHLGVSQAAALFVSVQKGSIFIWKHMPNHHGCAPHQGSLWREWKSLEKGAGARSPLQIHGAQGGQACLQAPTSSPRKGVVVMIQGAETETWKQKQGKKWGIFSPGFPPSPPDWEGGTVRTTTYFLFWKE